MRLRTLMLLAAPAAVLMTVGCEVQQEEEAQLPDVEVEEGELPEYEVEPDTVEVEEDTLQVEVPEVDVQSSTGSGSS